VLRVPDDGENGGAYRVTGALPVALKGGERAKKEAPVRIAGNRRGPMWVQGGMVVGVGSQLLVGT
jgi:hypothetical protein